MAALDTVMDPELDESVAAMGFVERVAIEGRRADITFRLPTFWCSANFAFLMATDMRLAVEHLPAIDRAQVRLVDHFASGKINRGVAEGRGFAEVFSGEAHTDLTEIRRAFRERALLGRQDKLLRMLVQRDGIDGALATTMAGLDDLTRDQDVETRVAALRYLALRRHEPRGTEAAAPAFITLDGAPVAPADYVTHLRTLRRIKGAAEANAEMCRLYLEARISHPAPGCEPENRKDEDDE
jgi:metal-sulfur cluster biosynthetic enzyme